MPTEPPRPPGYGNDCLDVDGCFIISLFGTNNVFTAVGESLRVKPYVENDVSQVWYCRTDKNNRYGFRNKDTNAFLGRDRWEHLACYAKSQGAWECLTFTRVSMGGYSLALPIGDRLCPAKPVTDSDGMYMMVVAESDTQIGLHRVGGEIFHRFEWVVPGQLARSSAPYYRDRDTDQKMDDAAVRVLRDHKIRNIISLNSHRLSQDEIDRLRHAGIVYTHIGLPDFSAPTLSNFATMNSAYKAASSATLVYCGYGHGRTGTAITALQMYGGRLHMSHSDYRENYVETGAQMQVLDELQRILNREL